MRGGGQGGIPAGDLHVFQTGVPGSESRLAYRLFVLDPVYGVLRSLRGMQPYRLEMGCKLFEPSPKGGSGKRQSLVMHWRESVTRYLGEELSSSRGGIGNDANEGGNGGGPRILANLASEEYSVSIHPPSLPPDTILLNVVFRHRERVQTVHAKRNRGVSWRGT